MNALPSDQSISTPAPFVRRVRRRVIVGMVVYLCYLLLIGPLHALLGNGYLDFVPDRVGTLIGLPSIPVFYTPGVRVLFVNYLEWWYPDPYRCGCCEPDF